MENTRGDKDTGDKRQSSEDEEEDEDDRFLLLDFVILEIKPLMSYISFLSKRSLSANLQFSKNGIEGIQKLSNEENTKKIDNVSIGCIPEWKLYQYTCNTDQFEGFDETKPNEIIFVLKISIESMLEGLKNFKAANTLHMSYHYKDNFLKLLNESTDSPFNVEAKFMSKKMFNPITDEIASHSQKPFMKMKCILFQEIATKMTRIKDKLANTMYIDIQFVKNRKGVKIHSSEPGCVRYFGDYRENKDPTNSFRINSEIMKTLSYFTKGNERGFIEFFYNDKVIRLSIELGNYLKHDFYIVKSKTVKKKKE